MNPEKTHGFQNSLIVNQGILPNGSFFFLLYVLSTCFLFSEINPFPYLMTLFDSKIVLLDMDQNHVVWTFSAEGDISTMGYTADNGMGYYAQGDSLCLLNMHNRSSSEVFHYVTILEGRTWIIYISHHPIIK